MKHEVVNFLGYACDAGAANRGAAEGPQKLKNSAYLETSPFTAHWGDIIKPTGLNASKLAMITQCCTDLGKKILPWVSDKNFFTVIAGDHSSAIGTWSGVSHAKRTEGDIGLIWVDAHMDSHTPLTSDTGNIHGMPVASLLGFGDAGLTELLHTGSKLKPENICLIGIRSFESAEAAFLKQLNVRVYFMDEVKQRGLTEIMQEAIQRVSLHTVAFGISIDLDSIDPSEAPGTGTAEPDGLSASELCRALTLLSQENKFIGAEIAEFDPSRDKDSITEQLIIRLVAAYSNGVLL